jgi:hypothetical protein
MDFYVPHQYENDVGSNQQIIRRFLSSSCCYDGNFTIAGLCAISIGSSVCILLLLRTKKGRMNLSLYRHCLETRTKKQNLIVEEEDQTTISNFERCCEIVTPGCFEPRRSRVYAEERHAHCLFSISCHKSFEAAAEPSSSSQMYTLLSGTWKYLTRREEYYVMIIGLDNAGKTVIDNFLLAF